MSTVSPTTLNPPEPPPNDPFYLGTRLVVHGDSYEYVPLTMEDVLHPQVEDRVTLSDEHYRLCHYLFGAIEDLVSTVPRAVVVGDLLIIWDDPELRGHGPDIALIFNVREHRKWKSFKCAEEGTRPTLLIEVTSSSTRHLDVGIKVEQYAQAGVEYYVIVDLVPPRGKTPRVWGYQLGVSGYEDLPLNDRGDLWIEPARCWLRVIDGEVVCEDEHGEIVPERDEIKKQRDSEKQRANAEAERANAAEQRLAQADARNRELEAELRRRDEST